MEIDASPATAVGYEHETSQQALQYQLEVKAGRNQSRNLTVLKATSNNAAKRLKMKHQTRITALASKTEEATIKHTATQELQAEKIRMQEWKANVMQEVARESQVMKHTQGEVLEAQRQSFQLELEKVREKLHQVETTAIELKGEMESLKMQKQASKQGPAQNKPAPEIASAVASSSKSTEVGRETNPTRKIYAQITALQTVGTILGKVWTEVTRGY